MLCCITQQSSKCYNRCQDSEVEKNKRCNTLDTEAIFKVGRKKRRLPFDVIYESSKKSKRNNSKHIF